MTGITKEIYGKSRIMRPLTTQKRRRRRSSIHPANTLELVMKNQELINQQYRRLLEASFGRNTRRGARTASSNISRFQQPKKHLAFQSRFQRPRFNERPNNRFKLMRRGNARQTPRKKNNATQSTTELDKQLDAYMGEDVRSTRLESELDAYFLRAEEQISKSETAETGEIVSSSSP